MLSRERETTPVPWVIIFVLLSMLVHVITGLVIWIINLHIPAPKLPLTHLSAPATSLTLMSTPPPAPPSRTMFLPTEKDPLAPPQKSPIESDNDVILKSKNKARDADAPLPDATGTSKTKLEFKDTPYVPSKKEQPASAPPSPPHQSAAQQTATKPAPPTPQHENQPPQKQPPPPKTAPQPPHPVQAPQKTENQVDPDGLPILPPLNVATLAPPTPDAPRPITQTGLAAEPPPSFVQAKSETIGAAGIPGDNTPSAMATELGRYKAKVYRAVGSRWYAKVGQQLQTMSVGTVTVQYTIHSDGSVDTNVIDDTGNNGVTMILRSISLNSIIEAAPFDRFTDSLKKEVGDSITDQFTFTVYGG